MISAVGDPDIQKKVARLATGATPRVLDVFSGCGGLSLGFQRAGFSIAGAVELDPQAAASHGANFHPGEERHARARNIVELPPQGLTAELGMGPVGLAVDVLVGGPPCQAFARVGRSKLREIDAHPEAFRHDPRARLYLEYLKYVRTLKPLALLMENVPDVLNHGGQNVAEETCEVLEANGYLTRYSLLNAAFYGVPQMRERMILIAYRRELTDGITFPEPSHRIELPYGYRSSRQVALKLIDSGTLFEKGRSRYVPAPAASGDRPAAVTAEAALCDLPVLTAHLQGLSRRGVRRVDRPTAYCPDRYPTAYGRLMRDWSGDGPLEMVTAHVTRHLPRDWAIFRRMSAGEQYPEAHRHAVELFEEALAKLRADGKAPRRNSQAYEALRAEFVPPYDVAKFPNKWRKMEPDQPARTLMAHLGKDTYSHIHYDSRQARTITVREAARLQSFPDSFQFSGAMNAAFRQVGNAVPPLLAQAVAERMRQVLQSACKAPAALTLRAANG